MFELFPSRTVALSVAGFPVHWYGIMYLLAFLLAFLILPRIQRFRNLSLTLDDWSAILSWTVVGVILGGRLGYAFFYEPAYYFAAPVEILKVWKGGMSSHGGFIGVGIGIFFAARSRRIPLLSLLDLLVVPTALGLMLGRIGNFINGELYGTVTTLPWGMRFSGAEGLRHPVQLYAAFKDLFIAAVCFSHLRSSRVPGRTTAIFLILYAVLRFTLEFFREQQHAGFDLSILTLTRGQALTLPIFAVGVALLFAVRKKNPE